MQWTAQILRFADRKIIYAFARLAPMDDASERSMTPVNQERINDTAKLIMHRLVARALAHDRNLVDQARVSLANMSNHFADRSFIAEWEKLLRLPTAQLRKLLTSRNQDMRRLRLSSPFVTAAGVDFGDQALRRRIRRAAKRIATRASRPSDRDGPDVRRPA